jgi:hypothetical protein
VTLPYCMQEGNRPPDRVATQPSNPSFSGTMLDMMPHAAGNQAGGSHAAAQAWQHVQGTSRPANCKLLRPQAQAKPASSSALVPNAKLGKRPAHEGHCAPQHSLQPISGRWRAGASACMDSWAERVRKPGMVRSHTPATTQRLGEPAVLRSWAGTTVGYSCAAVL